MSPKKVPNWIRCARFRTIATLNRSPVYLHTMGSKSIVAYSVENHLLEMIIWNSPSSFTVGENCTSAIIPSLVLLPWKSTSKGTPRQTRTVATYAITEQPDQTPWSCTRGRILVKSHIDVQFASIQASQLVIWTLTWWRSIQKKSRSIVTMCLHSIRDPGDAQEDALMGKATSMLKVQIFKHCKWSVENSSDEKAYMRKAVQM